MIFEWDEAKNRINIEKHGISFEEAKLLFEMPHLRSFTRHDYGRNRSWIYWPLPIKIFQQNRYIGAIGREAFHVFDLA